MLNSCIRVVVVVVVADDKTKTKESGKLDKMKYYRCLPFPPPESEEPPNTVRSTVIYGYLHHFGPSKFMQKIYLMQSAEPSYL